MMKKIIPVVFAGLLLAGIHGCINNNLGGTLSGSLLEEGFISPPDSIQTSVYWYWISDNISKEGVVRDLKAMKEAGINRAFIGNIGLDYVQYGNVKMLSDEWWEILHLALKTATELDIEIGIFNSPGWSQSGGPWVKAENAMRYLVSSETKIKGPVKISQKLKKPSEIFQDVNVIAFPLPTYANLSLTHKNAVITSSPKVSNIDLIFDGDTKTGISFPEKDYFTLTLDALGRFTARSLSVYCTENRMHARIWLQAQNEEGKYYTVKEFEFNRSNPSLNVGFIPYAPVVVSFPAVTSGKYRLVFEKTFPDAWNFPGINKNSGIAEIRLSSGAKVAYYAEKSLAKMHPTPLPYFDDYHWEKQAALKDLTLAVDPSRVLDLSEYMSEEGILNWDVPEGEWVILRNGMTPTGTTNSPASPEATGYEVDKMNSGHTNKHFYGHIGEILKRIPEADRKTFKVVVQDSYEKGGQNFTDGFLDDFEKEYGYDPVPFLPVYQGVVVESPESSDRFLWDMRRLVADKVAYEYVAGLRKVSHKHGLTTWLENYGHWGFPGEFLMYGGQSDEIGGEFWSEGSLGDIENRAATSCGHIYGKTKISAESHTCGRKSFSRSPVDFKQRGDRFFAEGINNTLLHVYIQQPYEDKKPGVNAMFGNPFNRKNTWFSQLDVFIDYIKRSNFMLQQGLNVADVCYFIGEDTPVMTGETNPPLPTGYQFDYINAEVIEKYMKVKNGLLTLPHGTQYRMMVLPELETMRPQLLKKIKQLVKNGGVILGSAPDHSPSLQDQPRADKMVKTLADELWGPVDGINCKFRKFGKGTVLNGMTMEQALNYIHCLPDCRLPSDNSIHYGHRTLPGIDIYFVSNQTAEEKILTPEFRVTGRLPELWHATTGSVRELTSFEMKDEVTAVPLKLEAYESVFVVFDKKTGSSSHLNIETNYPEPETLVSLSGPWLVEFDKDMRGPDAPVVFDKLTDWTLSEDDRIKYYSGTAVYSILFPLDKAEDGHRIILNLGSLNSMARVIMNGKYAGGVWTAPYSLDVTEFMIEGENDLKVEIVNNWMNRIIGDHKLPEDKRETWCTYDNYNENSPLQPSGLFGPVNIYSVNF